MESRISLEIVVFDLRLMGVIHQTDDTVSARVIKLPTPVLGSDYDVQLRLSCFSRSTQAASAFARQQLGLHCS